MTLFHNKISKIYMNRQNKHKHTATQTPSQILRSITLVLLCMTVLPYNTLSAKNTIYPFENIVGPFFINEYFLQYPYVPFAPQTYEIWLEETKSITQYLGFNAIDARVKYLDEKDTTYFEYVFTDPSTNVATKGKLFLRITGGLNYQILDVRFVPYFDLRKVSPQNNTTTEPLPPDKEAFESLLPSSLEITETVDAPPVEQQAQQEIPEEDYENPDPIQYPQIIPSIEDTKNSIPLFIDIAILDENKRKENLFRFNTTRQKLFTEQYVYTSKGALQRLIRNHVNGTIERFIYYFSTGGLKEVFYQDKDGSSYVLRYTLGGDLSEKQIRNRNGKIEYDERNQYTKKGTLISKIEVEYTQKLYTENNYRNGKITLKKVYSIRDSDTIPTDTQTIDPNTTITVAQDSVLGPLPKEQELDLLYEENFRYNERGETTGVRNRDILNERITISQYNDEGILTKEKYYLNGELEYEVVYSNNEEKQEIFYFKNEPILKIYYQENSKIKEEVLKNGRVAEIRQ